MFILFQALVFFLYSGNTHKKEFSRLKAIFSYDPSIRLHGYNGYRLVSSKDIEQTVYPNSFHDTPTLDQFKIP